MALRKFDYEPAPMVMAFILSPMIENSLRQSLLMSKGVTPIFLTRPISLTCLILAAVVLIFLHLLWKTERGRLQNNSGFRLSPE